MKFLHLFLALCACGLLQTSCTTKFENGGELPYSLFEASYKLNILTGNERITYIVIDGKIYQLTNYPADVLDGSRFKYPRGEFFP